MNVQPIQIWPWAIGAAPAYAFARHAESFLIGGLGRGGNAHGIDEYLVIEGFSRFIASVERWLAAMAAPMPAPHSKTPSDEEAKHA
jgi:hypothetical protein